MFLSAAMLLDHVGEGEKASALRAAIGAVVAEGRVRTYDMKKLPGGAAAIGRGAASTSEMTDAVIARLGG